MQESSFKLSPLRSPRTTTKENSSAKYKTEIVPASIIVHSVHGNIVAKQATKKADWCNNSVPQTKQKPVWFVCYTCLYINSIGTCRKEKKQGYKNEEYFESQEF